MACLAKEVVTTWKVESCPLEAECSTQSWQRAYVKSQTSEDHCRKILWSHLTVSSKHKDNTVEDIWSLAMSWPVTQFQEDEWDRADARFQDDHSIPEPTLENQGQAMFGMVKRQLGEDDAEPIAKRQRSDTGEASAAVIAAIKTAVEDAVKAATANSTLCVKGCGKGNLRFEQVESLKGALAATNRGLDAIRHACGFFQKGVAAFMEEQRVMEDVKRSLEASLHVATGGSSAAASGSRDPYGDVQFTDLRTSRQPHTPEGHHYRERSVVGARPGGKGSSGGGHGGGGSASRFESSTSTLARRRDRHY